MKAYCTGCGQDCSHAYGTWMGDPYHFGCIPARPKRRPRPDEEDEAAQAADNGRNTGGKSYR
jgi:hypothetical protein